MFAKNNNLTALPATWCVPVVVAGSPGYNCVQRCDQIKQRPGNQHVVIHADKRGYDEHAPTNT